MADPKDKEKKQTSPPDDVEGGGEITQEDFTEALDKVILTEQKPKRERKLPDAEKNETSE